MALVRFGGGVVDMRGSIAGTVFARGPGGAIARAKTKPVNPRSTKNKMERAVGQDSQMKIRAAQATLTALWGQVVTSLQRAAWELYAANVTVKNRLGESIKISGFNHFLRCNVIRYAAYSNYYADGPTTFEIPEQDHTVIPTPQVHEQTCKMYFDDTADWVDEAGAAMQIWTGRPQNPQRNYFKGPFLGMKDIAGKDSEPYTSPEIITNVFTLTAGQKLWYKFRIRRSDGRISEPFFKSAIVVEGPI